MKRFYFAICFLLSAILFTSIVLASNEVIITLSSETVVYTGKVQSINVTIQNNQSADAKFSITIWPNYWSGISIYPEIGSMSIPANSEKRLALYFDIPLDIDEIILPYNFTAKSTENEKIQATSSGSLRILRSSPAYIQDIILDSYTPNPEKSVTITTSVTNNAALPTDQFTLRTTVKKGPEIIKVFEDTISGIQVRATKKLNNTFTFDKYASPEIYTVESVLKDKSNKIISTKDTTLKVNTVANVIHEKSTTFGLLLQTVTIKVKNEGNSLSTSFYVTEDIPSYLGPFFNPIQQVTVEVLPNRILYHWLIPELMPGEERIVKYEINLWGVWVTGLIVVVVSILAFRYVYAPKIVKRHKHYGSLTVGKEIAISVDVKNRTRHEIKDVIVRDFVPSIVSVVDKFDTLRPVGRRTAGGVELIWKIPSLKPKEERVLTYRVRPVVDILGTLKLPKAHMRYVDKKKMRRVNISRNVTIGAR